MCYTDWKLRRMVAKERMQTLRRRGGRVPLLPRRRTRQRGLGVWFEGPSAPARVCVPLCLCHCVCARAGGGVRAARLAPRVGGPPGPCFRWPPSQMRCGASSPPNAPARSDGAPLVSCGARPWQTCGRRRWGWPARGGAT